MTAGAHVLVVDDDSEIRRLLKDYLQQNEYRVTVVADGKGMWEALDKARIDLIVLDLMLPGDDGLMLCCKLRVNSKLPIIMLTARGEEIDRILGLEMGADDYLAKPFSPRELLARIRGVLRRVQDLPPAIDVDQADRVGFAGWVLDRLARQLESPAGVAVLLSHAEYRLLSVFVQHPNRVLSRDQLLEFTQGRESDPFDRSIDVLVGRLRKRLGDTAREAEIIKTVRGEGYLLAARVEPLQS